MIERKTFNQNLLINTWTKKPINKTRFNIWFVDFVTKHKIQYNDLLHHGINPKLYYDWKISVNKPKPETIKKMSYALASCTGISSWQIYREAIKARNEKIT
jgi:hypothetical protein